MNHQLTSLAATKLASEAAQRNLSLSHYHKFIFVSLFLAFTQTNQLFTAGGSSLF
jgi:hypothetical protein